MMTKHSYALYKSALKDAAKECDTIDDFIDVLDGEYIVKNRYHTVTKRSLLSRINLFWVIPLFVISIPFQFIIRGDHYIDERSKFGRILQWLIGELI